MVRRVEIEVKVKGRALNQSGQSTKPSLGLGENPALEVYDTALLKILSLLAE
jgi:hypothetical protein